MLVQIQAANIDEERRRGEGPRHAHHRALARATAQRPPSRARIAATVLHVIRRDRHSLTDYPCRLPNGKIGRTAVVMSGGEWTFVCRVA
jgi:hypothetical protein